LESKYKRKKKPACNKQFGVMAALTSFENFYYFCNLIARSKFMVAATTPSCRALHASGGQRG